MREATIGEMRERVAILTRTETTNSQRGRTVTYHVALEHVAAAIQSEGGTSEPIQVGAVTASARHMVQIHHRTGVTPGMRVRWRALMLDILSVVANAKRSRLFLTCAEVQGG